jgi:hypothetical protein
VDEAETVDTIVPRLLDRREEIERALLDRVLAISDPAEILDVEYADGLRAAVAAAFEYGMEAVTVGDRRWPPFPAAILSQSRLAARNGVRLDTVVRRYLAGYGLIADFLLNELDDEGLLNRESLRHLLGLQASLLDHLLARVAAEYSEAREHLFSTAAQRRAKLVERILVGEPPSGEAAGIDFDAWHQGVVAHGAEAGRVLRTVVAGVDCSLLVVPRGEQSAWAWLGSRRAADLELVVATLLSGPPPVVAVGVGEPEFGLSGWRLTHRQAAAALAVARRRQPPIARYREVALLAAALQDDLVRTSLQQIYLAPLEKQRDGGETARSTLSAYFECEQNLSAAAARLGVSRRTVANRLRSAEHVLGCSISDCAPELETALQLGELPNLPRS